ncbi:hypothetical protein HBN76_06290 [Pseudomonas sp. WS 5013]|uniref:hypothetical protein n=1 Tax=Pseudomonas sp. WS 5013 TaxID=2717475 RepID=UPI001474554A|nr:hypothetical protein [Pseudomonas sp. WS 5013]NMY40905.1 hypothetical protein [Pseudomonas sp. WS 5013]
MDKAQMKAELLKATESLIDMANEGELRVLGELIGLQLLKACFVRRAGDLGMSAQQLESCRLEIEEKGRQVQELVQLLDECNANAVLAFTAPKH